MVEFTIISNSEEVVAPTSLVPSSEPTTMVSLVQLIAPSVAPTTRAITTVLPTETTTTAAPTAADADAVEQGGGLPVYDYIMTPSAFLSALCSSLVIYHIWATRRRGRNNNPPRASSSTSFHSSRHGATKATATFHRLLLGLCIYDVLSSSALFLEPFTKQVHITGHWTCSASGYFKVLGFSSASIYNAGLSIFSFLIVCRNWRDEALNKFFEPIMHLTIGAVTLFCTVGIYFEVYNPSTTSGCWAGSYPQGCTSTAEAEDSEEECIRGDPFGPIYEQIAAGGLILVMIILVVTHSAIFCTVRTLERRLHRYEFKNSTATDATQSSFSRFGGGGFGSSQPLATSSNQWSTPSTQTITSGSQQQPHKKDSKIRKVAAQSILYCFGFLGAYLVALIHTLVTGGVQHYDAVWYPPIRIIQEILFPLQGVINFLVYMRPKYLQWRRGLFMYEDDNENNNSRWKAIKMTLSAQDFQTYRQAILLKRRFQAANSVPINVPIDYYSNNDQSNHCSVTFALPPETAAEREEPKNRTIAMSESWSNENFGNDDQRTNMSTSFNNRGRQVPKEEEEEHERYSDEQDVLLLSQFRREASDGSGVICNDDDEDDDDDDDDVLAVLDHDEGRGDNVNVIVSLSQLSSIPPIPQQSHMHEDNHSLLHEQLACNDPSKQDNNSCTMLDDSNREPRSNNGSPPTSNVEIHNSPDIQINCV